VILLARDEAAHVEAVLSQWRTFLDARGQEYEILVVDDGSNDRTCALLEAHASSKVRYLRHDTSRGQGAALRTGLETVQHPLIFYTLCKPEYRPEDLGTLLDRPFHAHEEEEGKPAVPGKEIDHVHIMSGYRAGVKVPIGWRVVGGVWRIFCRVVLSYAPHPLPGWLGLRRHLGRLLGRIFFGLHYQDILCPFRLLRRDILARIPIQSDGPFAHAELLAKANFLGFVMGEEQPIPVVPGPYQGDFKQIWREARRVYNHPDFGPAVLPKVSGEG
jgi:glycosyltransferase involved in cell wall biosynthesis